MAVRILILTFFLWLSTSYAQPLVENNFVNYTTVKGITGDYVTGVTQDATGYIWITTKSGLNRFNGSQFVSFHSSSDSLSIGSEVSKGCSWLTKNLLGIYSIGLHIINTQTGETKNLFIPYKEKQLQYKFNSIQEAIGDEQGNIYVLTHSGFYQFDKEYKLVSRFDYYSEKEIPVEHFSFGRDLFVLDNQRLLITSVNGLYVYDKTNKEIKKMTVNDCPILSEFLDYTVQPYIFLQPAKGKFIILKQMTDSIIYIDVATNKKQVSLAPMKLGTTDFHYRTKLFPTNDSLFYLTNHTSGFYKLNLNLSSGKIYFNPQKYFSSYLCTSLFTDHDHNLWIATSKGLFRQDKGRIQIETISMPRFLEDSFPNSTMQEVFVTKDKIYVGTRTIGTLLIYDKSNLNLIRTLTFEEYRKKSGHSFNVYSIKEADANTLLLATDGWPLFVNKDGSRSHPFFPPGWNKKNDWSSESFKDSKGAIWISSSNVYQYQPELKKFTVIPRKLQLTSEIDGPEVILEDKDGYIWMAGHGISRYNPWQQKFDRRVDSFPFIKMPDKQVSTMVIDKEKNMLWFNSNDNGLLSYNITNGSFQHFTTGNGLPDNNISSLVLVGSNLWIACASGVAALNLQTNYITGFGKEDGFPDMPVLNKAGFVYDSTSQLLYLAFSKAIARFNPTLLLHEKQPPKIFIEDLSIGNHKKIFLPQKDLKTSWNNNQLTITIGTINFSDPSTQRYAYRVINDAESPWIDLGSQPSFSISNLSPGKHQIQVKTYSITNRWPEQVKEIHVEVSPPLWKENWFYIIVAALVLASIYFGTRWRTEIIRKKEMEKTNLEKLKADHYKNQYELEQITNYFSSSLAGKKTEDAVLWDVAANLISRLNYEDCIIYLWNKDKTRMVQKAAYGPKGKPELISADGFEVIPGQGIVGHVMKTKQPVLVNDTRKDKRYRIDDKFRLSEVAVPIIHNDDLLGVIDSEHTEPYYYSERDIKILTTIATLIANKLKQLQSEQSLEAKQKELTGINEQLAEARLSALQAQMNPHFVFNALNSIKRMILDDENEKASRYLSKFALMIRLTLEHSKEIFVSLDDNIAYLRSYLDMEKLRFDDSFNYTIHADDNVDTAETAIPSMMIQPLVENAIWHGLMQHEGEKNISVNFTQEQNKIICTIKDNGVGIHQSKKLKEKQRPLHRSVGLENLQKRIRIMNEKYNTACSLEITDLNDENKNTSGTKAVLQLNIITTFQRYESNIG